MVEENRKQEKEDQSKNESDKAQAAKPGSSSAINPAEDEEVRGYSEPSDGSGGTKSGS